MSPSASNPQGAVTGPSKPKLPLHHRRATDEERYVRDERFIRTLHALIRIAVRILALMMVAVIFLGVGEAGYNVVQRVMEPPFGLLNISAILATFGSFISVLIAIEIFHNIVLYLRDDVIRIRLVLATALMAIARKVIVLDFKELSPMYVFGVATVVGGVGAVYWLVVVKGDHP